MTAPDSDRPDGQANGGGAGTAEAALDLSLEPVADDRRRHEGKRHHGSAPGVEAAKLVRDHTALADQKSAGRPGVERHLEALASLGVELAAALAGLSPGVWAPTRRSRDAA